MMKVVNRFYFILFFICDIEKFDEFFQQNLKISWIYTRLERKVEKLGIMLYFKDCLNFYNSHDTRWVFAPVMMGK